MRPGKSTEGKAWFITYELHPVAGLPFPRLQSEPGKILPIRLPSLKPSGPRMVSPWSVSDTWEPSSLHIRQNQWETPSVVHSPALFQNRLQALFVPALARRWLDSFSVPAATSIQGKEAHCCRHALIRVQDDLSGTNEVWQNSSSAEWGKVPFSLPSAWRRSNDATGMAQFKAGRHRRPPCRSAGKFSQQSNFKYFDRFGLEMVLWAERILNGQCRAAVFERWQRISYSHLKMKQPI